MAVYYNEFDPKAAAWLRELIKQGLIADGEVDTRDIREVRADDLRGFTQSHFFAGIGGWSYSLRLAGIPDDEPVWTASLPCQPFSSAGKQLGKSDERHLWPHFIELVRECGPNRIFGEQVEAAIRHGWLDDLQATMEAEGYAVGHCVLGAHSVGSFHQRQRLYWVANSLGNAKNGGYKQRDVGNKISQEFETSGSGENERRWRNDFAHDGCAIRVADSTNIRCKPQSNIDTTGILRAANEQAEQIASIGEFCATSGSMGIANGDGQQPGRETTESARHWNTVNSAGWHDPQWLYCRDNKYRPIKPGIKPLVNGFSAGVVLGGDNCESINPDYSAEARAIRLKGYGNAIVPQVAAAFIGAFYG